jgi:RHS repeat-associated protein
MLNTRHIHKTDYIPSELTENYRLGYDNACRLIAVRHALNTQKEILMDSLVYDETGRVSKKILHGGIQTINYTYTIQNRLKSIDSEKFGETLYYQDSPYGNACYNGNIAAETFGAGDDKRYSFSYDQMNRLTGATNGSNGNFAEEVGSYDKNGNIKRIQRNGYVYDYSHNVTQGPIDDLTLNYNGNHLKSVSDATDQSTVITTNDFLDKQDEAHPDDAEYRFDANGNLTADLNKGVALIRYNLLNLPQKVQFQNGTKNEYLYDASGVKHRAGYNYSTATSLIPLGNTDPTKENNAPSTFQTDYCSNYVYEKTTAGGTPVLRRIITPEGYITTYGLTPMSYVGNWRAVYCMKDHQGNTRVNLTSDYLSNNTSKVYTASDQIDYYPFGMERSNTGQTSGGPFNSGANPYLYSGKETDRMNGLNEYDFSARWLDNAVPGFTTPDPLAELHCGESPYMYCGGDPVNRVDPTGLDYYSSGGKYYYIANCHETTPFTIKGVVYTWVGEDLFLTMEDGKKMYGDPQGHFHETGTVLSDVTTKPDNPSLNNLFVGKPDTPNFAGDKDGGGGKSGNGEKENGQTFNTMAIASTLGGIFADGAKATGVLGSTGVWKDLSRIKPYWNGWTGNGTVKTFGNASALGYGLFGVAAIANVGLSITEQQSWGMTGVNIGINAIMLRMPLQISIGYGIGSLMYITQQSAFNLLNSQGYGDNPMLYNTDFLH